MHLHGANITQSWMLQLAIFYSTHYSHTFLPFNDTNYVCNSISQIFKQWGTLFYSIMTVYPHSGSLEKAHTHSLLLSDAPRQPVLSMSGHHVHITWCLFYCSMVLLLCSFVLSIVDRLEWGDSHITGALCIDPTVCCFWSLHKTEWS